MAVVMIGYDLHPSRGKTYDDLLAAIPKVGNVFVALPRLNMASEDR